MSLDLYQKPVCLPQWAKAHNGRIFCVKSSNTFLVFLYWQRWVYLTRLHLKRGRRRANTWSCTAWHTQGKSHCLACHWCWRHVCHKPCNLYCFVVESKLWKEIAITLDSRQLGILQGNSFPIEIRHVCQNRDGLGSREVKPLLEATPHFPLRFSFKCLIYRICIFPTVEKNIFAKLPRISQCFTLICVSYNMH